jgi:large conductance mechanosensitive channel
MTAFAPPPARTTGGRMLKEFREFIMRGNVVDLAVGVIIGGAFGKIVSSLVSDIIMPPIGLLLNGVNFSNLFISLTGQPYATLAEAQAAGAPTLNYGSFINAVIDFLIIGLVIFLLIRAINRMQKPAPAASPQTRDCPFCFSTISLKATRCPNCTSQL